jgi:hypothetical protein
MQISLDNINIENPLRCFLAISVEGHAKALLVLYKWKKEVVMLGQGRRQVFWKIVSNK